MYFDASIQLVRETLTTMLFLAAPILLAALVVGLAVSVLQAATQIQEQTLSFVPKILGMGIVAIMTMPWMYAKVIDFSARCFGGW